MTLSRSAAALVAAGAVINGMWSTYCVHTSITLLRTLAADRRANARVCTGPGDPTTIVIVVPMLHEADRAADCVARWSEFLDRHDQLRLCVVTTERECTESQSGQTTWGTLECDERFQALLAQGRADVLHYPRANRTYGEQLGWALDRLIADMGTDYVYVTNIDSRLNADGCAEILELAAAGVMCAQQSTVFFANLSTISWIAAGEAFYQSRWTFETEIFRYLAGSGRLMYLPKWLCANWYQHSVGHGLLMSRSYYLKLGGLPQPTYGLEDAALGFAIRARGGHIEPFTTLECGDAPASARELQRQRSTWIRGPLCAFEYRTNPRDWALSAQGIYNGLKWAWGLPVQWAILLQLPRPHRYIAMAGLLLGLYGPVLRLVVGLGALNMPADAHPRPVDVARGLTAYPLAAVSFWLGGLRGASRLLVEIVTRQPSTQPRTRNTT